MAAIGVPDESFWRTRMIDANPLSSHVSLKIAASLPVVEMLRERLVLPLANYRRLSQADESAESRIGGNYLQVPWAESFNESRPGVVQRLCNERR